VFIQAMLSGLYTATFVLCLRWLVFTDEGWKLRSRKQINWPMLILAVLVFGLATVDLLLSCRTALASVTSDPLIVTRLTVVVVGIEVTTMLITDAVLILRCWVIYGKSWRIICLPLVLWSFMITGMILFIYWNATATKGAAMDEMTKPFLTAVLACNFANNSYVTFALTYRILRMAAEHKMYLYKTCRVFAESGILYSMTSLALFVSMASWKGQGRVALLCDAVNFSTAGIAFNLILIRAARYRARQRDVS